MFSIPSNAVAKNKIRYGSGGDNVIHPHGMSMEIVDYGLVHGRFNHIQLFFIFGIR